MAPTTRRSARLNNVALASPLHTPRRNRVAKAPSSRKQRGPNLSIAQRGFIVGSALSGAPTAEIAKTVGRPDTTVRKVVSRTAQRMSVPIEDFVEGKVEPGEVLKDEILEDAPRPGRPKKEDEHIPGREGSTGERDGSWEALDRRLIEQVAQREQLRLEVELGEALAAKAAELGDGLGNE
ncbi:hypothetical protein BJ508DRAFT_371986 [Ascobolus immersus RN42]|uniref:Uncharacterized protein n=1 Tax=Ascobolus immersus RN42 TaxID=1160509 RepID=A0A3N4INI4_ASCIM|nr:hypothetical protein BJ508DRAFT_371986 [Ascobolus immersus RN42]